MRLEIYEKREQTLQLRTKVLQAEQERIDGVKTRSIEQARKELRERINEVVR